MDTRDTPEQAELRRAARQLARALGPATVADLDDTTRAERLAAAIHDAGWLELRDDGGDGDPLASGVEAAILAEGLAERVADTPFAGPVLARDLARRAGAAYTDGTVVACSSDLIGAAVLDGPMSTTALRVVDASRDGSDTAYVLVPDGDGHRLALVSLDRVGGDAREGADLTRTVHMVAPGAPVREVADQRRLLLTDDLLAWHALGLALTSADLVGLMRGVLDVAVAYASERRQFGVPVGSFQAVQHLLAEARCLLEGSHSVALHASWAVDSLAATDACAAGQVAKAYCARAARTVCETAIQVHGGIGNTWECNVHVYLRRALLSSQWFGDDGEQLRRLELERLGVPAGGADGLS
jgi:alkylation response protein AidB-like acyl-CoA dehydrogenase